MSNKLQAELDAIGRIIEGIPSWQTVEGRLMKLRSDLTAALARADKLEGEVAALEARQEPLELAASELVKIAKLMKQDDGVDPESWWIELSGEDGNLVKMVAENVSRLDDDPTVEDGPNTAARRANFPQNYCKHGTLKGHCPNCP